MDKKIKTAFKSIKKKEGKEEKMLLKADKKLDAKVSKAKKMMKKGC